MLRAVNMGWEQPRRSALSRRRSILRLRLRSRWFIDWFTRKPSPLGWMGTRSTPHTPQKGRGFSGFLRFRAREGRPSPLVPGLEYAAEAYIEAFGEDALIHLLQQEY